MQIVWNENSIELHGVLQESPQSSHMSHGVQYDKMPLGVQRLSGAIDYINVVFPHNMVVQEELTAGDELTVVGEVRSFNNRSGLGSRLVITVYAREFIHNTSESENRLKLTGTICKEPIYRRTPLGRDICDMMVAVNRKYGRTDYLPCIAWGSLAQRCSALAVGDSICIDGRLQSRSYTKRLGEVAEERIAYEVSIMSLGESE